MLVGEGGVDALASASVIVFGIGGVGSYVTEGLARAGVGRITLVDKDTIPGSISFVPSVAGLMIAGEVIRDICARKVQE